MGVLIPFFGGSIAVAAKPFSIDNKIQNSAKRTLALEKELANPSLSEDAKKIIQTNFKESKKTTEDLLKKQVKDISKMSNENFQEVLRIENEQAKLKEKAIEIKTQEGLSKDIKKQLLSDFSARFNQIEVDRLDILSGKKTMPKIEEDARPEPGNIEEKNGTFYVTDEKGITKGFATKEEAQAKLDEAQELTNKQEVDKTIQLLNELNDTDYKEIFDAVPDDFPLNVEEEGGINKSIAELYNKSKEDGSNPNLVQAVEKLSNKPTTNEQKVEQLRAEEQAENAKIEKRKQDFIKTSTERKGSELNDDENKAIEEQFNAELAKTYDKYDKLITPLLRAESKKTSQEQETSLEQTKAEIEKRRVETESKIKRKDLFTGVGEFSTALGNSDKDAVPVSHNETNGIEFVEYAHPDTGSIDVIVTGKSNNDFVGFYRIYENGKPTNKWSSKFENKSRNKEDFKTMISGAQELLPEGHQYTEKTSISTDGLRVWNQQLNKGYELQYDANGNLITNEVAINGDAIVNELGIDVNQGNFDNISVTNNEQFESVKKAILPYLQKFGLDESNIRNVNGAVKIDLPVLLKSTKGKTEAKPTSTKSGDVGAKKPTIVVHGAVNGFGLQYSEGIDEKDIVAPKDARGFLPQEDQVALNKGNSVIQEDSVLENGDKKISIITPATDNFGRSAANTFEFVIPTNNTSTTKGIQSILDNVRNGDLKGKELIDETVKQVKEYINSNELTQKEAAPVTEKATEATENSTSNKFEKSLTLLKEIDAKQGVDARNAKRERNEFLKENPTIKYIDDNYKNIVKQLEKQGLFKQLKDC
jgi:hypothetical protein